jgi:hypothetical protein
MQSGNKCFTYALAADEYGSDRVHSLIGKEPSGASFNSLFLNADGITLTVKSLRFMFNNVVFVVLYRQAS